MTTSIFAPATATPRVARVITLAEAQALIWQEAELLDTLGYKAWLDLWTAEGYYVIPTERGDGDPVVQLNLLYDDDAMRRMRVKRLTSGFAMASFPPARTVRTVSRFVVAASEPGLIAVRGAQILVEYKYDRTRIIAADVTYRIVATDDGLKLDQKVVTLINADDPLHGIGYLL